MFRVFCADRRGATAIVFALALIPVLGLVGGAIDFERAHVTRAKLQGALDAAVLAAGAMPGMSEAERAAHAQSVFAANYPPNGNNLAATPEIGIAEDGVIAGAVNAELPTYFLGLFGVHTFDVGVSAQAMISELQDAEIVLVLDYSLSMVDKNKYGAMRDAAVKLVDTLSPNGANNSIKFGLVPFSGEVYVSLPREYVVGESGPGEWTNCTADRRWPYNIQDTTPTADNDDTKWGFHCPHPNPQWVSSIGSGGGNKCMTYDSCSGYPARNLVVRPLTGDASAVIAQLNGMEPIGWTHIAAGLEFGWHLIAPNPPFTQAVPYGTEGHLKAIVLLTDGHQTSPAWGPGNAHNVARGERNLEEMCEAIKAKEVMLFTVGFDLDHQPTLNRLRNCATSPSHFFDAKTNADLATTFQAISGQLARNLHLSR